MSTKKIAYIVTAGAFAVAATAAAVVLPDQVRDWTGPAETSQSEAAPLQYREGAARFVVTDIKNGSRSSLLEQRQSSNDSSEQADD